jgi:hypothetical protein
MNEYKLQIAKMNYTWCNMKKSIIYFLMVNVIQIVSPEPLEFTSIVFIATICSWQQPQNKTKFEAFYLQEFSRSLNGCSKGNVIFSNNASKNIAMNVNIPCVYKSVIDDKLVIDNRLINEDNTYGYVVEWMRYALQFADNINDYRYKLLVVPSNDVIPWRGLGKVGGSFSWYNTHDLDDNLYLHEIGHNLGLGHAMKDGEEYGDDTCVMGAGTNCYTAPHRHFLGWDYPMMTINLSSSSWNKTIHMKKNGEFMVFNNNLYIESSSLSVNAYILQNNISTSYVCKVDTEASSCYIADYAISITFMDTFNDFNVVRIEHASNSSTPIIKNSASSIMLNIYNTVCSAFVTYNIVMFFIALW